MNIEVSEYKKEHNFYDIIGYIFIQLLIIFLSIFLYIYNYTFIAMYIISAYVINIFILLSNNNILKEIKLKYISAFIKTNNIKLYIAVKNYWPAVNLEKVYFIEKNNKIINANNNIYISIRRTVADDLNKAFKPIYDILICKLFLTDKRETQKFFNFIYFFLIINNFIYYFSFLVLINFLYKFYSFSIFLLIIILVSFILINFAITLKIFFNSLIVEKCDTKKVIKDYEENNGDIFKNNIFIVFNFLYGKKNNFNYKEELNNIDNINKNLYKKIENIYQITSPIIFLSQVTIGMAFLKSLY